VVEWRRRAVARNLSAGAATSCDHTRPASPKATPVPIPPLTSREQNSYGAGHTNLGSARLCQAVNHCRLSLRLGLAVYIVGTIWPPDSQPRSIAICQPLRRRPPFRLVPFLLRFSHQFPSDRSARIVAVSILNISHAQRDSTRVGEPQVDAGAQPGKDPIIRSP
jgi:hypothetical protein